MKTCNRSYEHLVADVVGRHLGASVVLTPIPTYPDTIVYEARAGEQAAVFKACDPDGRDPDGIGVEAWACETARAHSVPAPEVLVVDTSRARFPASYFLMRKAAGRPLDESDRNSEQFEQVARDLGEVLRRLHEVRVPGFGWLDEERHRAEGDVRGTWDTWRGALLHAVPAGLEYLRNAGALSAEQTARIDELLASQDGLLAFGDGRLLHGDLGALHVWVDARGTITSLVDLGERASGDPVWDFVELEPWLRPGVLAGYEPDDEMRARFDETFRLYVLLRAIPWAHKWHARGETQVLEWLTFVVREVVGEG